MPNPVKSFSSLPKTARKRIMNSKQQSRIVRQVKRRKLPVKVYARANTSTGYSVHNPFLDVRRKAVKGSTKATRRIPQARDTKSQITLGIVKARKTKAKKYLLP